MKKDYSEKFRNYSTPSVNRMFLSSDLLCSSEDCTTEDFEIDDTFEW